MNYQEICEKVCGIAREAGEYIAEQRETFTFDKVEFKGVQNHVSYVDKQTEELIIGRLRELTPDAGFIAEEGTDAPRSDRKLQWIIDPLDGTTNFIHGLPPYCVSIGLMDDGELVAGVIYEVTLREMFYAWKGSEAFLNGRVIKAAETRELANALVAVGFSYATDPEVGNFLEQVAYYQRNTNGIRRLGSAAADLAYVACGRFDAYSQVNLAPWDVAAGALIARQAGAVVSDFSGGEDFVFGREIIAAAPGVYAAYKTTLE